VACFNANEENPEEHAELVKETRRKTNWVRCLFAVFSFFGFIMYVGSADFLPDNDPVFSKLVGEIAYWAWMGPVVIVPVYMACMYNKLLPIVNPETNVPWGTFCLGLILHVVIFTVYNGRAFGNFNGDLWENALILGVLLAGVVKVAIDTISIGSNSDEEHSAQSARSWFRLPSCIPNTDGLLEELEKIRKKQSGANLFFLYATVMGMIAVSFVLPSGFLVLFQLICTGPKPIPSSKLLFFLAIYTIFVTILYSVLRIILSRTVSPDKAQFTGVFILVYMFASDVFLELILIDFDLNSWGFWVVALFDVLILIVRDANAWGRVASFIRKNLGKLGVQFLADPLLLLTDYSYFIEETFLEFHDLRFKKFVDMQKGIRREICNSAVLTEVSVKPRAILMLFYFI
jgi:hypothetical protein